MPAKASGNSTIATENCRIANAAALEERREAIRSLIALRHDEEIGITEIRESAPATEEVSIRLDGRRVVRELLVCGGTGCRSSESAQLIRELREQLAMHDITDVEVIQVGCFGFCAQGPIVKVMPEDIFYVQVKLSDAARIVEQHVIRGEQVADLLFVEPSSGEAVVHQDDMAFYGKQMRVVLRNCGLIDPESINEYIAADGYAALAKCLTGMTPAEVTSVVQASGLRGRGGGGFPTGLKWSLAAREVSDKKYVLCNADEGDPGAFMDRSILEGDPHCIVEAMTICGYAIGSDEGIVYIRAEYPLAVSRLELAISEARAAGLLGENILGTDFSFDIHVSLGAGAFVCGEETALIHSVEGQRGEPTRKPPFPAVSGYLKKPTNVNNVETYANIPPIIRNGSDWFRSFGTEKSTGTKVFALAGKINNIGLVEVPMGTTLREIVDEIGGGIPDGKKFKAVQTGGPSGGVITEKDLDTPIDYESLTAIGSMMGSGGMIVMDEDNDMVEIARFYLDFTTDESCGKCTPCRVGSRRILEMLDTLLAQEGDEEMLEKLESLCMAIKDTALCGLGQTAPNPVLSTMKYFPEEYLRYARREVQKAYSIDPEKCIGCTRCARACPVNCISGKVRQPHVIDPAACIACGACQQACPVGAVNKPR
ncbi:MAG: NADH-quinone oxidoreductase subunit NuoF [Bacillota bacterium]|nr:NADH-quinone oxidoreductase subunit NuoF [Bacillota bacterium]